jgi:hypothetical protein
MDKNAVIKIKIFDIIKSQAKKEQKSKKTCGQMRRDIETKKI